jgi:hypothetical protein
MNGGGDLIAYRDIDYFVIQRYYYPLTGKQNATMILLPPNGETKCNYDFITP